MWSTRDTPQVSNLQINEGRLQVNTGHSSKPVPVSLFIHALGRRYVEFIDLDLLKWQLIPTY
jgi:hypothetical protein